MEDLDFVTRLERSGQTADAAEPFRNRYFAAARLPRFSGPRPSWADQSSDEQLPAHQPIEVVRRPKPPARRRIRRSDQGDAVGNESASRNRKFESTSLQRGGCCELYKPGSREGDSKERACAAFFAAMVFVRRRVRRRKLAADAIRRVLRLIASEGGWETA
jgi:hypothetical protein